MELPSILQVVLADLLKPLPLACISLIIAWCTMRSFQRFSRVLVGVSALTLMVFSSPQTTRVLLGSLENQHPPISVTELPKADIIVLLTGSLEPNMAPRLRVELGSRADRLLLAHQILSAHPSLRMLIAGAPASNNSDGISEAEHSRNILGSWGIDMARIRTHNNSQDTVQTAQKFVEALPSDIQSILLITSAYHMPRAMQLFSETDFKIIPATANHLIVSTPDTSIRSWLPSSVGLSGSTLALHEYLGMLANLINLRKAQ